MVEAVAGVIGIAVAGNTAKSPDAVKKEPLL